MYSKLYYIIQQDSYIQLLIKRYYKNTKNMISILKMDLKTKLGKVCVADKIHRQNTARS